MKRGGNYFPYVVKGASSTFESVMCRNGEDALKMTKEILRQTDYRVNTIKEDTEERRMAEWSEKRQRRKKDKMTRWLSKQNASHKMRVK